MVWRRGVLACALLTACVAEPTGRADGTAASGGDGGKADDASGFDPALSDHQNEVAACMVQASKDRAEDSYEAEADLLDCVFEANDAVWPEVQAVLPESIPDEYTGEMLATKGDEVRRYIDRLRASQGLVCEVYGTLLGGDDEDDGDLAQIRCLAQSEIHTANLIDAHFDLDGRRLELVATTRRFQRCQDKYEDDFAEGFNEIAGPLRPEEPATEAEWIVSLHHNRRDCMKGEDAELRVDWAADLGDFEAHREDDFRARLRIVTSSFERESRSSRLLCSLFAHQDEENPELAHALCMADSTMQAGQLYDMLRAEPEVDPTDGEPDEPDEPDEPTPMPLPEAGQACYPGPEGKWDACIDLVYPASELDGYDYAPALNGNANYRKPIGFIDLDAVDGSLQVSRDFKLQEIAHRWKGRYAVVQPHAVDSLQQLRDDVGSITVNSGYRSPKYNRGVGGATFSRHMYGDGFDMDPNAVSLSTLEDACQNNGGFLVEYTSHVHCDFRFTPADTSFYGEG